jgi:putative nucleotidyltransferase with HDIG domain
MTVPQIVAPGPAGTRAQVRSAADLLHAARARERVGGLPEAAAGYERAISSAERTGEPAVLAEALRRLAVVRHRCNRSGDARHLCHRSFTVAREAGNDILAAEALNTLGGIELEAGPLAEARSHFQRAVELGGASRELRARVEQNLGILASIQGDLQGAVACYTRSLEAYQTCGDEHGCAIAYHNLGMVSAQRQLLDEADQYFTRSYAIAARANDVYLQVLCLLNHAEVFVARGRYEAARRNAEDALARLDQVDDGVLRAQAYRIIGMVYRDTGRPALAEARLRSAIDLAVGTGSTLNEATARRELAILYQGLARNQDALMLLNDAHTLFGRLDARGDLVYVDGKLAELEATYLALVSEWGQSIESSDTYTFGHCERVARHAVAVAQAMRLDDHAQTTIRLGAYLHDVGKVRVPHELLNKPGPLTHDEFEIVQTHPIQGIELLAAVEFPWDLKPIIRWHHEKYDGTGYPDRLRGDEIPVAAQIVGIVDVYDALTTDRSYRPALSLEAALAEIARCKGWWSEAVYTAFQQALAQMPVPGERTAPCIAAP